MEGGSGKPKTSILGFLPCDLGEFRATKVSGLES